MVEDRLRLLDKDDGRGRGSAPADAGGPVEVLGCRHKKVARVNARRYLCATVRAWVAPGCSLVGDGALVGAVTANPTRGLEMCRQTPHQQAAPSQTGLGLFSCKRR